MKTITPAIIDGPAKGQVIKVDPQYRTFYVPVLDESALDWLVEGNNPLGPTFTRAIYYLTNVRMFGWTVMVASISPHPPSEWQLFDALASDSAKKAVL